MSCKRHSCAYRFYDGLRGANCRAWLLTIVRNTCCTWLQANRAGERFTPFDEELHGANAAGTEPDAALLARADRDMVRQAMEELPAEFREVFVLREVEGVSYKDIAEIAGIPVGTVMSRLARRGSGYNDTLPDGWERRHNVDCQQSQHLMHGYLDGELDAVHSVEMESHLQSCSACRRRTSNSNRSDKPSPTLRRTIRAPHRLLKEFKMSCAASRRLTRYGGSSREG